MLSAFETKDSAKVNAYYAPGAVIATPGRPAAKDARALTKAIKDDLADPNLKITVSHEKTEVSRSGDMGYRRGSFKNHDDESGRPNRRSRARAPTWPSSGSRRTAAGRSQRISEFSAAMNTSKPLSTNQSQRSGNGRGQTVD